MLQLEVFVDVVFPSDVIKILLKFGCRERVRNFG